jgi:8-oxo-dGTP diphosphatase
MIRTASAIITNKDNQVLLQHRDNNARNFPNTWALWGGAIEEGETPIGAMIRELHEELNIVVAEDELTFFKMYENKDNEKERHIFLLKDLGAFAYNLQEGDDLRFFSQNEIADLNIVPMVGKILTEYFAGQK